jgi:heat shock protein HslJ
MPRYLCLWLLLLTACTFVSEPIAVTRIPPATAVPPTPTPALLNGTEWKLTDLNGRPPLANSQITLTFANGTASGFAGCNSYGGPVNAPGDGTFTMTEIEMTAAECAGPEGVMAQEAAFVEMLAQITSYRLQDDQLEMANAAGEITLIFTRVERFDMNPAALIDTAWQLQAWGNRELLPGTEIITLIFDSAGEMSGFAGCRHYQGTYFAENDTIRFPTLSMVEESCPLTDDFLIQEGDFTTALSQTTRYRLQDGQLELFTAPGEVLLFLALDEQSVKQQPIY